MARQSLKRYRLERLTWPTEQKIRSPGGPLSLTDVAHFRSTSPGTSALGEETPLILVVDDSYTIQKIIEMTLHRAGYEVCLFSDGVEALSWLKGENRPVPRLMLLDIQLPKLDGYDVARTLRA